MSEALADHPVQVLVYRFEHAGQQLHGLGQADPADLGQLVRVAHGHLKRARGGTGSKVDHVPLGRRMLALAEHVPGRDLQAGFFLDLADDRVRRRLARFLLAGDERPRRPDMVLT